MNPSYKPATFLSVTTQNPFQFHHNSAHFLPLGKSVWDKTSDDFFLIEIPSTIRTSTQTVLYINILCSYIYYLSSRNYCANICFSSFTYTRLQVKTHTKSLLAIKMNSPWGSLRFYIMSGITLRHTNLILWRESHLNTSCICITRLLYGSDKTISIDKISCLNKRMKVRLSHTWSQRLF